MITAGRSHAGRRRLPGRGTGVAGFTILELLLVIALIAALCGMVLGAARYVRDRGRTSRATAELAGLAAALESYRQAQGDYPRTNEPAELLQALVGRRGSDGESIMAQAVIEAGRYTISGGDPFLGDAAELHDPWNGPYRYAYKSELPWSNPSYVLYSGGPDGLAAAALLAGGYPAPALAGNGDNLWANPP